jgi:acetolactate synthase-1/2/3 large subunit
VNRPIDVPLVGDLRGVVPQLVRALGDAAPLRRPRKFMKMARPNLRLAEETGDKSDGQATRESTPRAS